MSKTGGWNPPMHKGKKDYWRKEEDSWQSSASPADRSPARVRPHRSLQGYACVACRVQKHIFVQRRRERRTRGRCLRFRSRVPRSAHGDRNPAKSNHRQQTQQPANPHGLHSSPLDLHGRTIVSCRKPRCTVAHGRDNTDHLPSSSSMEPLSVAPAAIAQPTPQ